MIKSMTGFGKSTCIYKNKKLIIEIKSLNSKFVDINPRLPNGYREKELELRGIISEKLQRGKIDFVVSLEESGESSNYSINKDLAMKYFRELQDLSADMKNAEFKDYLPLVMRLPDVMVPSKDEISDDEWKTLTDALEAALRKVDEFRIQEGASLKKELEYRTDKILGLLELVTPYEKDRIELLKAKIKKDVYELADHEDVDKNRFEQELIYYIDRMDITEEKVRLKKHCKYFLETLDDKDSQGKKLAFISQEMGREINTLGSKANDASIQKIVVQMKDELEKIKEQLFNIL